MSNIERGNLAGTSLTPGQLLGALESLQDTSLRQGVNQRPRDSLGRRYLSLSFASIRVRAGTAVISSADGT